MEWLVGKYHTVKTAFKACFGLNCLGTSSATASEYQPVRQVTIPEAAVVQPGIPSGSTSEDLSHDGLTKGGGQPLDVAPANGGDSVRPPVSMDYGVVGSGETSPPVKLVDVFIPSPPPPLSRRSLPAESDSVGSGADRRDEASPREPRRKALLVGTLSFTASLSDTFFLRLEYCTRTKPNLIG
jgi:hypothetical protein